MGIILPLLSNAYSQKGILIKKDIDSYLIKYENKKRCPKASPLS